MLILNKLISIFINSKNKYKYDVLWIILSLLLIPVSYFIFSYLLGSKLYLGIIIIAVISAKLIAGMIGEIYEPLFGDKRYTPFLKLISYSMTLLILLIFIFVLMRDSEENQSVVFDYLETQSVKETEVKE